MHGWNNPLPPVVKHLKRGCVRVWRDESGRIVRRRLYGRAFKGEVDHNGAEATWVISAPAQRAVDVLERLQPTRQKYLFALLPSSPGYMTQRGLNEARTTKTTNADLSEFRDWINTYCRHAGRDDGIPSVNGQQWRVTTSQFRRTLAWFIARRPGGVIAGALQYRHLRVQMFEDYAGTSDSGFRDEVESEEAIARGEKLGDLIRQRRGRRSPGAVRPTRWRASPGASPAVTRGISSPPPFTRPSPRSGAAPARRGSRGR